MRITTTIPEDTKEVVIDKARFIYNGTTKELSIPYYVAGEWNNYTFSEKETNERKEDDNMIRIMCKELGFTIEENQEEEQQEYKEG